MQAHGQLGASPSWHIFGNLAPHRPRLRAGEAEVSEQYPWVEDAGAGLQPA